MYSTLKSINKRGNCGNLEMVLMKFLLLLCKYLIRKNQFKLVCKQAKDGEKTNYNKRTSAKII